ncbi:MAG: FlgD immunoglobulin-like domain containing protein [candidate division KSB1 bacterium]|nr:FlgD immunoglobulin-like domain containing protein [candidate division KSB1 bacterium]
MYPNPFNPNTTIDIKLEKNSAIKLCIYNTSGRLVRVITDRFLRAGLHSFAWNGVDRNGIPAASGVYLIRLQTAAHQVIRQATLLK